MNSIVMYRNPLEQWFWEGEGALFILGVLVAIYCWIQIPIVWKRIRCKHDGGFSEDSACDAWCRKCGKNLGFIGNWRNKK